MRAPSLGLDVAAMEPGHEDREESATSRTSRLTTSRNGARSRGPGRGLRIRLLRSLDQAAMEPGHEDREEQVPMVASFTAGYLPQWSPVTRTGKRSVRTESFVMNSGEPQWSPVTRTGKRSTARTPATPYTGRNGARSRGPGRAGRPAAAGHGAPAAMEPGHEDREESPAPTSCRSPASAPQWFPVTRTGKRGGQESRREARMVAAMEPGHEDREERGPQVAVRTHDRAAMEPGHEDREEPDLVVPDAPLTTRRNGARSRGPGRARRER